MALNAPAPKQKITAAFGREIVEQINRNTLRVGAGLQLNQTPNGSSLSLTGTARRERAESPVAYPFKISGGTDRDSSGNVTSWNICLPPGCLTYGTQTLAPEENLTEATMTNSVDSSQYPVDGKFGHCYVLILSAGEISTNGTTINCLVYLDDNDAPQAAFIAGNDYSSVTTEDKLKAIFTVARVTANGIEQVAHGGVALSAGGAIAHDRAPWAIKQDEDGAFYFTNLYYRIGDELHFYDSSNASYVVADYANKILWLEVLEGSEDTPSLNSGTCAEFNARVAKMQAYAQVPSACCDESTRCQVCADDRVLAVMPLYEFGDITDDAYEIKADLRPVPTGRIGLGGTSYMGEDKGPFKLMSNSSGSYTIYDCYYQVGSYTGKASDYTISAGFTGLVYLSIPANAGYGSAVLDTTSGLSSLNQNDMEYVHLPIYEFVNGTITMDFRRLPTTGIVEWYGAASTYQP